MESIGKAVTKISGTLASQLNSGRSAPPAVRFDPANLPAPYERAVDMELPRKLWCGWRIDGEPRAVRRPLTEAERGSLERRAARLEPALAPYLRPNQDDEIALAITEMLSGFRGARETAADAVGRIAALMDLLSPFPAWAIQRACSWIHSHGYEVEDRDGKRVERHWPPADAEIAAEVERAVKMRREALASARALLEAPVAP